MRDSVSAFGIVQKRVVTAEAAAGEAPVLSEAAGEEAAEAEAEANEVGT